MHISSANGIAREEGQRALRDTEQQASSIYEIHWLLDAAGCCMYEQQRLIAGECTYYCALHVLLALPTATYIMMPNVACGNG